MRIKNLLGGSETCYRNFINRYDYYVELSKNAKNRIFGSSNAGTDITFHPTRQNEKTMKQLNEEQIIKNEGKVSSNILELVKRSYRISLGLIAFIIRRKFKLASNIHIHVVARMRLDHNALWSPARSGNHWVRFIAEYLTSLPTQGCYPRDVPIYMNRFPNKCNPLTHVNGRSPYILYKEHTPYRLTAGSVLILLIRDFHEYIAIDGRRNEQRDDRKYYLRYILPIKAYDDFIGTKILIYYEDLILKPEREILRIKNLLDGSETRYRNFINRYDYYVELSKNAENRIWGGSNAGTDITFHQTRQNEKTIKQRLELFHRLLSKPQYRQVKPYIDRYMT